MKRISPIILLLLSFFFNTGNICGQCDNTELAELAANKINAQIPTGGDFFWNRNYGKFVVPYTPGPFQETSTIFAGALWLGGLDTGGNLKMAAQTYGNSQVRTDFWPGPIDDNTLAVLDDGCENFERIWKTNRGDILQVKEDFEDNNMIDLPIPNSVQAWPAKGNPFFEGIMGFALPDQELAPFFDRNSNGNFEPLNGDYPLVDPAMPNAIPDEMTWTVFNDIQDIHSETYGLPIGAEIHFMAYAFNCSDNEVLNYTVFTRHKVFNKSGGDLSDFKMGFFLDADLGCFIDDFFGCDTILNTLYIYNSSNDDNDPQCTGIGTYGVDPPVQAITFLNHKMSNLTYFNNGGFNNPPIGTTDPAEAQDYYNYLTGKWRDGSPFTYGESGYNPSSTDYVNHVFPDPPSDPNGWSMINNIQQPVYDRRTVMSAGPFDLPAGEQLTLDAAFSYHRQPGADHLENVDVALAEVPDVKGFYDDGLSGSCSQFLFCDDECVRPGDAGGDGIANNDDLLYLGIYMGQNATGTPRSPASYIWAAQQSGDWGSAFPGLPDPKHCDSNGDGQLDDLDFYILEKNYGSAIPGYVPNEIPAPFAEGELYIDIDEDMVSTTATMFQRRVRGDIMLASQDEPIDALYAISFAVEYDPNIWETFLGTFPQINLDDDTFLGTADEVLAVTKVYPEKGRIEVAISRKDGQAVTGAWGKLGTVTLGLREDAATGNANGMQSLSFQFYDAKGVGEQQDIFLLDGASDVVIGMDMVYDSTLTDVSEKLNTQLKLNISPNPNSGDFNLFFEKTTTASQISIFDFNGKTVWTNTIPANAEHQDIDLSGQLPTGVYFVKWVLADGQFTTGKVIVK